MHELAAGSAGPVGLAGSLAGATEPPLSTETIGRAPSILEPPTPLHVVPDQPQEVEELREGPVASPVQMAELLPQRAPEPVTAGRRRVVVRLVGEGELELGTFDDRSAAVACAMEAVSKFSAAERAGEWPEIEDRRLRPASIVSVDILVAA
jgi:hypothetical protein